MIDQLLRSLRLKCKGLNKLRFETLKITLCLSDYSIVEGFEHLIDENFDFESDSELLSLSICGQNDTKVGENKKLKPYIKSVVKTEKCEQDSTGIKTETNE